MQVLHGANWIHLFQMGAHSAFSPSIWPAQMIRLHLLVPAAHFTLLPAPQTCSSWGQALETLFLRTGCILMTYLRCRPCTGATFYCDLHSSTVWTVWKRCTQFGLHARARQ